MCRRYMHALMTASCTAVKSTRVLINARYALRVGTRSDKMTLVMLREMTQDEHEARQAPSVGNLHSLRKAGNIQIKARRGGRKGRKLRKRRLRQRERLPYIGCVM